MAIPLHKPGRRIQSRRLTPHGALGGRALRPANQLSETAGEASAETINMSITALRELSAPPGAASTMGEDLTQCSCRLAGTENGQAYNEEAFRYFLEIERKRSEVSRRPFLLLLVDLKKGRGAGSRMSSQVADRLFSQLALCLRDTDFVGWYRDGRVAGAVLTQRQDMAEARVSKKVANRVKEALRRQFDAEMSDLLQVRVYQIPSTPESDEPATSAAQG
jgi:hypothetical protein